MELEKLGSADARKLSSFLRSKNVPDGTLTFAQLKGYLFCICTTPELLTPSFWLAPIFDREGELPEFEAEADSGHIKLIIRLYNQINTEVLEGNPKLPNNCTLDAAISNNFRPGSLLHEWSWGFDYGLSLTQSSWENLPLEALDLEEEVESLWSMLSFFASEQRARRATASDPEIMPFNILPGIIRRQLPWLIKDYAVLGRTLYESVYLAENESDEPFVTDDGVGYQHSLFGDVAPEQSVDALIDAAYDAYDVQEAASLANQALNMDPDCVDAFLLLANCAARNPTERCDFLEQAVKAGERALGPAYFEENACHFWGQLETRPYMRARSELASACRDNKQSQRAIGLLEKSLQLNFHDNQGNRFLLVTLYLEQQQYDDALKLLDNYAEDGSAFMCFSRLLLSYITEGDSPNSKAQRRAARGYNKYVAQYLSGRKKLPKTMPDHYGLGDRNEAILYAADNRKAWRQVAGAIPWLLR